MYCVADDSHFVTQFRCMQGKWFSSMIASEDVGRRVLRPSTAFGTAGGDRSSSTLLLLRKEQPPGCS